MCDGNEIDLCYQDPGKDVDVYLTANSRDMIDVWMGDLPVSAALADDRISLLGEKAIRARFRKWFPLSSAAGVSRPSEAERNPIISQ